MAKSDNPKKVEDQGSKADDLQKEIIEGKKTPEEKQVEALAAEEAKKVKAKEEKPPKVEVKPGEEEPVDFEQKYNVLQGKYDSEVPRLQGDLTRATETIANQNTIISSVQQKPAEGDEPGAPAKKEDAPTPEAKVKPEDFEGYGEEMIDLVNLVKDQAKTIKEQNEKLKVIGDRQEQIGEHQYESDSDGFYAKLTQLVPDWQTINKSKEFLGWLAIKDPFIGIARQALLDDAHSTLDLDRVVHFFNAFKGDGGKKPEVETPVTEQPAKSELEAQIVPDTSAPVTTPGAPQVPKVTRAQLAKASKDYQTGRITEEEFNKVANQVQTAIAAGAPI